MTRSTSSQCRRPRIGVLALQGDFAEHAVSLSACNVDVVQVRTSEQLQSSDALIIPGGESTTIVRLLNAFDLVEPIRERIREGMPTWGTCAGAILLATEVPNLDRPPLAAMDITVERNAFGRQLESFETDLEVAAFSGPPLRAIFIRAPVITRIGRGVEVLARLLDGRIVAARQGVLLATAFHPELTTDHRMHALFVDLAAASITGGAET